MFSAPVDSAKYIGGLSKSLANSVWNYFLRSEEEELNSEGSDSDADDFIHGDGEKKITDENVGGASPQLDNGHDFNNIPGQINYEYKTEHPYNRSLQRNLWTDEDTGPEACQISDNLIFESLVQDEAQHHFETNVDRYINDTSTVSTDSDHLISEHPNDTSPPRNLWAEEATRFECQISDNLTFQSLVQDDVQHHFDTNGDRNIDETSTVSTVSDQLSPKHEVQNETDSDCKKSSGQLNSKYDIDYHSVQWTYDIYKQLNSKYEVVNQGDNSIEGISTSAKNLRNGDQNDLNTEELSDQLNSQNDRQLEQSVVNAGYPEDDKIQTVCLDNDLNRCRDEIKNSEIDINSASACIDQQENCTGDSDTCTSSTENQNQAVEERSSVKNEQKQSQGAQGCRKVLESHQLYQNLHLVTLQPVRKKCVEKGTLDRKKGNQLVPGIQAVKPTGENRQMEEKTGDQSVNSRNFLPPRQDELSSSPEQNVYKNKNIDDSQRKQRIWNSQNYKKLELACSISPDNKVTRQKEEQEMSTSQRCFDNTQYLYSKLRGVYGLCTDQAVREAVVQLNTNYSGYMMYFCDTFLDPALELIRNLKKSYSDPGYCNTTSWPVCCEGSIIIHLQDTNQLLPGKQYIYIKRSTGGQIHLARKSYSVYGLQDVILRNNCEIRNVLNMEWSNRFKMKSDDDLGKLLQKTMSTFEDSIERIKLEDSCKDCNRNRNKKIPSVLANRSKFINRTDVYSPQMSNDSQCNGGQPRSPGFYNHRNLDIPKTIMDVDYDLLQSGIAILPGCRDIRGGAVIFIFTGSPLWQNQQVSSTELARLLLYYRSVPRDEVKQKGLTIVTDVRGSNSSTINMLLEAIYLFEGNIPNCISSLLFVADHHTESLVLKSPVYDSKVSFKCSILLSLEQLCDYIELDQLPLIFHGLFVYCHEDWVRFHNKLDPFLSKLRATAKYLICVMQDLSDTDNLPKTSTETHQMITQHEESVKSALCDQRLISLQSDGKGIISDLRKEEEFMSHTEDYRDCMRAVDHLYSQVQTSMVKLVKLAESRLRKLEKCLHLREFEEESNKVITWLQSHGGQIAERYSNLADNLKAIRSQQKDFEKFHFSAMSYIEKGNDLLEEAGMLAQSGNFDDATGYKELARTLKKHLQDFTGRLEATRERIESSTKCYHLLDKSYEWALEAMKYVASMKMDHSTSLEGLEKLLRSLEHYLRQHPAMSEATFNSMSELANKLQNEKLSDQCRVAKARCIETNNLLNLRLGTLRRAREKMLREQNLSSYHSMSPHQSPERIVLRDPNSLTHSCCEFEGGEWNPAMSSTPAVPSSAIHPAFRKCNSETSFSPCSGSSFITKDLSDHVVTNIPKVLNDTTLKSSREDLTEDTPESAQTGKTNSQNDGNNSQTSSSDFVFTPPKEPGNTLSSHNRPVRKMIKRTSAPSLDNSRPLENGHPNLLKRTSAPLPSSVIIEEDETKTSPTTQTSPSRITDCRPVSMITASTDSLSSLPEEEDQENSCTSPPLRDWNSECGSPPIREWTPVPVNTHLSEFNRNVPTGSLAGLKLSGKESSKSTLAHVMCEMVQTERDYVQSLQYIIENYIPELQREDVPQALRGKRNVIFGNIEKIYQFHYQYFLKEVQMCEQKPFQISQYFLMHENFFYLYALYNKNKPKSDALMAEYGKQFFKSKQEQLGDRMDLSSYLLKPVQRMGKYALMLKQIMKECPQSDQAYHDLRAAEQMVKFQLRHGNDLLAMDALKDCDVNLQEQGRLLRQDEFLIWQGRKKSLRHVFLFEDMILFSKAKRNRHGGPEHYVYKHCLKMSDIGLTENYGESGYKFEIWFRRIKSGESYIFQAPNSDVKQHWTKAISKILWNQALKNRDRHMTEMATMGIGNKPCLDIKPSANNIQDRFINYAIGNRGARTRNSVAVSSFDHSRLNNKRPHSIISIGSTSSSNSSHSGMFINPGATGDPFDSPRHVANTCLSYESGIGTDTSGSYTDQPSDSFHKEMSPSHRYHMISQDSPQHYHMTPQESQYHMTSQEVPPLAYSSTDV